MTPTLTVAKYIVQNCDGPVSNLKLQKLLYYVQGWSLGIWREPVFPNEIQAWIHGPVVPVAFHEFRRFSWNPIVLDQEPVKLDPRTAKHIKSVLKAYGPLTAPQLEQLSHTEAPWIEARKGLDSNEPSQNVISNASMKSFFAKLANG